ncbi:MAG TPA: hypothetical protein VD713_01575, partial [Sphingomonadales bacterium]|nr:hypothetical protein [Sphingomonadales bacterium]
MILRLKAGARDGEIRRLIGRLAAMGFKVSIDRGEKGIALAVINGMDDAVCPDLFVELPLVESVAPFRRKYKLASHEFKTRRTVIQIGDVAIGGGRLVAMAGPCAIESEAQIHAIAERVAAAGAQVLRGGAFKPRTSPYDFQGLGEKGLRYMRAAADAHGLLCVSEAMS